MRYVCKLLLVTGSALLTACGGGNTTTAKAPPIVWDDPPQRIVAADYYAPLGPKGFSVPTNNGDELVLAQCSADILTTSPVSCIGSVTLDGAPASAADLAEGEIAEIHGSQINSELHLIPPGPAGRVTIDINRSIVGLVEAVDSAALQLTVLGQRVYLDDRTVFDSQRYTSVDDIAVGEVVTISGHFTASGRVLATRIDAYAGDPLFLVRGVLAAASGGRLAIGNLDIDLAAATPEGFPASAPLAGDAVVVFAHAPPVGGVLAATTVRCTGECTGAKWDNSGLGFVQGFVTAWRSWADFEVDGHPIRLQGCLCSYGPPPPVGSLIELNYLAGELTRGRAPPGSIELSGPIENVDLARDQLTVQGTHVQITPGTYVDPDLRAHLSAGDSVSVGGGLIGNTMIAGRIDPRPVDSPDIDTGWFWLRSPEIWVAGQKILTDASTVFKDCAGRVVADNSLFVYGYYLVDRIQIWLRPNTAPPVAAVVGMNLCQL